MLLHQTRCNMRVAARGARRAVVVRASYDSYGSYDGPTTTIPPPEAPGQRVEKWLKTPFDLLTFGPRAGVGALLSLPDRLQNLQTDVNRAIELLQDPRPVDQKVELVLREAEETVVEFLEKGATVETDILANVKTVLPADIVKVMDEYIPDPPNKHPYAGTTTTTTAEEVSVTPAPVVTYYQADVQDSQIASEMTEIRAAVASLRAALDSVRTNTDISNTNMLRLKLREARDLLSRRLGEVSPSTATDANIAAATREARILLEEVDAQFF